MDYAIIHEFNNNQIKMLHDLFKNEWWTQHREITDIKEMIQNSSVVIGVVNNETGELIGFARVITDSIYRAFIFDVITKEQYRNCGVGTVLMEAIFNHPKLKRVERVELYCLEKLIPYYEKFGFSADVNGSILMRKKS